MHKEAFLPARPALLEREPEVSAIQGLVRSARGGTGGLLVAEGGAGMGKTRLLGEARAAAGACGLEVVAGRGGELEQGFAFGIVRQLFEPLLARASGADQTDLMAGAAALARPLFDESQFAPGPEGPAAASFAMLHGLSWLLANLAFRQPTLVVVDDLHWADEASLRWIAYLAPRIDGLPLLLALAARPPERSREPGFLTQILSDPAAVILRPGPLRAESVAVLARAAFGAEPEPGFVTACQSATGGNPLFLQAVLDMLAREGVAPTSANASRVAQTGPAEISRLVSRRLARLPPGATSLIQAAAILGDRARLALVAELAGLDGEAAAGAADVLMRAELLRSEDPVEFMHPVIRTAIYEQIGGHDRRRAHRRAGELLAAAGVPVEQAAAHLSATLPAGDPRVSETLRQAAERSLAEGAPQAAVSFLRRAIAERAPGDDTAGMLSSLGTAELRTDAFSAADHLRQALTSTEDPLRRGTIALQYARALSFLDRFEDAVDTLNKAVEAVDGRRTELLDQLEARLFTLSLARPELHRPAADRIASVHEGSLGGGLGDAVMRAVLAYHEATRGASRNRCVALCRRALHDGWLLRRSTDLSWILLVASAFMSAGEYEQAVRVLEEALTEARRRGDPFSVVLILRHRGVLGFHRGDLLAAEEDLRSAEIGPDLAAVSNPVFHSGYLASVLVDRGEVQEATRLLDSVPGSGLTHDTDRLPLFNARGRVLLEAGAAEAALREFRTIGAAMDALGVRNPATLQWRSQAALAMRRLGRLEEAAELAREELKLARRWGAPRSIGIALRALGLVQGGRRGEAQLRHAVEVLEPSGAQLEQARALIDLGGMLRRSNRRDDAREPLRRGLELAYRAGAAGLVKHAQDELAATGARLRTLVLTGVEALTPSERRVARMAAEGMANKEIAQALFVTVKAVEVHLSSAYRKLQIKSRTQLPDVISGTR
jgi:DNA-binding CsgD family transcriptional regulator